MGSTIIGRDGELFALLTFVSGSDPPGALVLEGEAGIGKTILWDAGVAAAEERLCHVLVSRPSSAEAQLSFAGLGDLLENVAEEALPALAAPQRRALRIALLLDEPEERPPDPRAIATAFLNILRGLAKSRPVVLAIDDVQWLDAPSLGAIVFALRRLRDEPVRFLLTRRTGGAAIDTLGLSGSQIGRISLGPLSLGALFELVRKRLDVKLPRPTLVRLHETSGGNPFFALAISRALVERRIEHKPDEPLPLPEDLRELVRERIASLPRRTRRTLCAAAALSSPTAWLLAAADADPQQTHRDLEQAARAGVIELQGERIRFAHPLLASACYAEASAQERRDLHRALAGIVRDSEEQARHLALGAEGPDPKVAARLEAAARDASARGAPGAAAELSELAIRLAPGAEQLARCRLAAAGHHITSGDIASARGLLEPLVDELPPGPGRARALLLLAKTAEDDVERYRRLADRALEEAEGDDGLRAEIHDALAVSWIFTDLTKSVNQARARVALVEAGGDLPMLVDALGELAFWETYTGRITPGVLERAQSLALRIEDPSGRVVPLKASGVRLLLEGRFDDARPLLESVHRLALEGGDEYELPSTLGHLRLLEVRAGNWKRAERYAVEGQQIAEQLGLVQTQGAALYGRALVAAHMGRVDEARAAAQEGLALSEGANDDWFVARHHAVLGFLELSLGEAADALEHLRDLPGRFASMGYGHPGMSEGLADTIEAHIAVGQLEEARDLIGSLEASAAELDLPWAAANASRCRGLIAEAEGSDEAIGLFERALEEHARQPVPFELGRTMLALGESLRRAQQKRAARDSLEQAIETFEGLGAGLWSERARSELGRIGGRSAPRGELTATERRIVELVAAGRTNRQAAEALHLSPKTVAWNLSKIYRKLGVRSRTELAASRHAASQ